MYPFVCMRACVPLPCAPPCACAGLRWSRWASPCTCRGWRGGCSARTPGSSCATIARRRSAAPTSSSSQARLACARARRAAPALRRVALRSGALNHRACSSSSPPPPFFLFIFLLFVVPMRAGATCDFRLDYGRSLPRNVPIVAVNRRHGVPPSSRSPASLPRFIHPFRLTRTSTVYNPAASAILFISCPISVHTSSLSLPRAPVGVRG